MKYKSTKPQAGVPTFDGGSYIHESVINEVPQRRLTDWLDPDGEFIYGLQYMRPTVDKDFCFGPRFRTVDELQEELELIRKTQDQSGADQIVYKLYDREMGFLATWIGDKYDDVF